METFDMDIVFPGETRVDAWLDGVRIGTGGEGEPSPFDLFLAGIGTCSGIKVLRFCQERHLPTEGLSIQQRHFYNPETHMIEKITMEIRLPEGFPEKYRGAAIKAAESCGVKKHLANPPSFEIFTSVPVSVES
jgi:putative redox protein